MIKVLNYALKGARLASLRGRLKSEFLRNTVTLMTGTTVAQIITIATVPIMTRLFSPVDYGLLALYASVTGILTPTVTGMYAKAIVLSKDEDEAANTLALSIAISIGVSLMIGVTALVAHRVLMTILKSRSISVWLYVLPLSTVLNGFSLSLNYWMNRKKQYAQLSSNRIIVATAGTGTQLGFGLLKFGGGGLILSTLVGSVLSAGLLGRQIWHEDGTLLRSVSWCKMRKAAREHRHFPQYVMPTEFINIATNQIPVLLLNALANAASVGLYGMTQRVLALPTSLIAGAVTDVFTQRAASDYLKYGNCRAIYLKTFKSLLLLGIAPFGVLILFGPALFSIVFGARWAPAGEYARYMSIMFFFGFFSSPLSYVYYIVGKQKEDLILHLFMALSSALSLIFGRLVFHEPRFMILAFSINYALIYLIYLVRSFQFSKGLGPKSQVHLEAL